MQSVTQPRPRARAVFAIAVSALLTGAALAAEPSEPAETPRAPADELDRGTPRGSVLGYLLAGREGDWERAARFLNLSPVPKNERARRGPELARQLKTVLDRTLWVERLPRDDGTLIWKISGASVARIADLYDEFGYGRLGRLLPPFFFERQLFEIQLWQWIGLLLCVLAAWLGSWLAVAVIVRLLRPVVERSKTEMDDHLFRTTLGPLRLFFALGIFALLLLPLGLSLPAQRFAWSLEKVLALAALTWFLLRLIDLFGQMTALHLERRGQAAAVHFVPLGRKTVKVVIVALASLAALDSFGFDVTALIAGLGIGGLAIALALQKTLENLFGGATLLADRPVKVGDFCRFGDKVGSVEEIGLRSTRVRTLDRTVVTVPNAGSGTTPRSGCATRPPRSSSATSSSRSARCCTRIRRWIPIRRGSASRASAPSRWTSRSSPMSGSPTTASTWRWPRT
jgi:MscS family membrane protein